MSHVILRISQVRERTGLSRSTIYNYMSAGKFPRAYALGPRTVGWLESEINQWINQQVAATRHRYAEAME
jgi:prophage regulatory protein